MPLKLYRTRELLDPKALKLKVLVFALPGAGKTTFMSTADNPSHPLVAGVCETGHGKGQLSTAIQNYTATDIRNYAEYEEFCSGGPQFKDFGVLGLDSLSWANKTFIKDKALSIPRAKGESQKRMLGVPELDDYGSMGELCRKLTQKLIDQPQHIVVTAGLRIDKPDAENGGETLVGPDLPGAMFLGSTAMFDLVLCLRTRSVLRDPKDAKSRYIERYFLTENVGGILAKNRLNVSEKGISFLPTEVVFDKEKGTGTFDWFLNTAINAYQKYIDEHPQEVKA